MAKDKAQQEKRGRGRPSKYDSNPQEMCRLARVVLSQLNATNEELAAVLGVDPDTIYEWQNKYPEFSEAIKEGKETPDNAVKRALYSRAVGYSHEATKIFCTKDGCIVTENYTEHYPPSEVACIFWLTNRRPDEWRKNADNAEGEQKPQRRLVYEDWGE